MHRTVQLAAAILMLAPLPAPAQSVLTPGEYEALSERRTLHYTHRGRPFGAEQYFPGRRSIWRFANGACSFGEWHAEGENICFRYESDAPALCWQFMRSGERLSAVLLPNASNPEPELRLDLSHVDDEPLPCPAPDLGM